MNKTTVALSKRQYKEIIKTMREGGTGFRPNVRIATALVIEAIIYFPTLLVTDVYYCFKEFLCLTLMIFYQ